MKWALLLNIWRYIITCTASFVEALDPSDSLKFPWDETGVDQSNTKGQIDTSNDVPHHTFPSWNPGGKKGEFDAAGQHSDKFDNSGEKHQGYRPHIIVCIVVVVVVIIGVAIGLIIHFNRAIDTKLPEKVTSETTKTSYATTQSFVIDTKLTNEVTRGTTKSPDTTTQSLHVISSNITLAMTWNDALADQNSQLFLETKSALESELIDTFRSSSVGDVFTSVDVNGFRSGSVIADFTASFGVIVPYEDLVAVIINGVEESKNNKTYTQTLLASAIKVGVIEIKPPKEVTSGTSTKSPDTTTQSSPPGETCKPTSPDIWGPYYITTPPMQQLKQFCAAEKDFSQHDSLLVHGKVYAADCKTPLQNMRIEVWQADHDGHYMVKDLCRGYVVSDRNGSYEFSTTNPGKYTTDALNKEYRPAHLHFHVVGGQGHKGLVTQMYFKGDTNLGRNDSCSGCSSDKPDLITERFEICDSPFVNCTDIVHFDIVLAEGTGLSVG